MYYYKKNLGDYMRVAAHLNLLQHGIYNRLLDMAYDTERPLPADLAVLARKIGARNKTELAALEEVLREFFDLTPEGWSHPHVEREVLAYHEKLSRCSQAATSRWGKPERKDGPYSPTQPQPQPQHSHQFQSQPQSQPQTLAPLPTTTPFSPSSASGMEPPASLPAQPFLSPPVPLPSPAQSRSRSRLRTLAEVQTHAQVEVQTPAQTPNQAARAAVMEAEWDAAPCRPAEGVSLGKGDAEAMRTHCDRSANQEPRTKNRQPLTQVPPVSPKGDEADASFSLKGRCRGEAEARSEPEASGEDWRVKPFSPPAAWLEGDSAAVSPRPGGAYWQQRLAADSPPHFDPASPSTARVKGEPPPRRGRPRVARAQGSLEELRSFALELGLPASDGEFMYAHWTSNGWRNGLVRSRDWQAGMLKWKLCRWLPSQRSHSGARGGWSPAGPRNPAYNIATVTAGMTADDIGLFAPDQQ